MFYSRGSSLEEIGSRYPKYESQLYTIPGPPSFLQDDCNHRFAFGHRQVSEFLSRVKEEFPHLNTERGFKINELPHRNTDETRNRADNSTPTCLYIPRLDQNIIFGFKFVQIIDNQTVERVLKGISDTLEALEAIILPITETSSTFTKVEIKFLIILSKPKKKCKKDDSFEIGPIFEQIRLQFSEKFESLRTLKVSVEKINKDQEDEVLDNSELETVQKLFSPVLQETGSSESGNATEELCTIVNSVERYLKLPVNEDEFCFEQRPDNKDTTTTSVPIHLDIDGLSLFMESHFKNWESSLTTVPFFDQIRSGLLFKTDKYSGKISSTEGADEYIGEMENFWKELICLLNNPSGLLLKSYKQQTNLNKILKFPFLEEFQLDWMFLSNDQIIIFEIGRSNNLDSPVASIKKKLTQVFTNILPKIQFMVWGFLKHLTVKFGISQDKLDSLAEQFLQNHVKVFIFFPNISKSKFQETLAESWKKAKILNASQLSWDQIYFLVEPPQEAKKLPVFLKVKKDLSVQELESQILESLLQCGSKNDLPDSSTKFSSFPNFVGSICALFAIGYFLEDQKIQNFDQKNPLTVDERFGEDQINFLGKEKILRGKELHQLKITLSPQQLQILEDDKKLVLLVGEPGTGKTVVLLARAFLAAQDPEVSQIYFFSPCCKTSLREKVNEFVDFSEYKENFMKKNYKFLSEEELFGLMDAPKKVLHQTVLFLDEIYFEEFDYDRLIQTKASKYRQSFFQLSIQVFPHLRACWMANIVAPIMRNVGKRSPEFFAGDIFNITPLSVQYRSSKHISLFSSTYLHSYNDAADTSSSRTPGCFLSSEFEVHTLEYSTKETLDFSTLDNKLGQNRWAIVFCEAQKVDNWKKFLTESGKFTEHFVNPSDRGCHDSEFGGGETDSVVMIIDHVPTCSKNEDLNEFSTRAIYSLAITRAQLSLRIYIQEKFSKLSQKFISMQEWSRTQEILMKARTARPIDFSQDNRKVIKKKLGQLYHICIKNEDTELMKKLMDNFPEETYPEEQPSADLLIKSLMGGFKREKFLDSKCFKEFKKRFGERMRSQMKKGSDDFLSSPPEITSIVGALKRSIDMSCLPLVQFIFGLFGSENEKLVKEAIWKFPVLMRQACFKGDKEILDLLITKLNHFRLLDVEMNKIYKVWEGETTLLTLLCYCNCSSKAVNLILDEKFPENLYLHEFLGKNALQIAIEHNNREIVEVLLKFPERQAIFLGPNVSYEKKTASEFARSLGFDDLADDINIIEAKKQKVDVF